MIKKLITLIFGTSAIAVSGQNTEFIDAAYEGLQIQTAAHTELWSLGQAENWAVDMKKGTLTFTFEDGKIVTTTIQVVGTYNTADETFLWGWDHPSVPQELAQHAKLAKKWGIENNEENFATLKLSCSMEEVWRMAAVVNRVADANGVYRGISGNTAVFMTMGEIEMNY
ncbi:MAG: DUF6882 domain-containing protein [Bacteroidota bacterium]